MQNGNYDDTKKNTQTDVKKNPNVIDDQKALSRIDYKEEKKKKTEHRVKRIKKIATKDTLIKL